MNFGVRGRGRLRVHDLAVLGYSVVLVSEDGVLAGATEDLVSGGVTGDVDDVGAVSLLQSSKE